MDPCLKHAGMTVGDGFLPKARGKDNLKPMDPCLKHAGMTVGDGFLLEPRRKDGYLTPKTIAAGSRSYERMTKSLEYLKPMEFLLEPRRKDSVGGDKFLLKARKNDKSNPGQEGFSDQSVRIWETPAASDCEAR
jgi:hypothetical protein